MLKCFCWESLSDRLFLCSTCNITPIPLYVKGCFLVIILAFLTLDGILHGESKYIEKLLAQTKIVTIYPGMNRPYYLKNQGKQQDTYIRLGGKADKKADKKPIKADKKADKIQQREQLILDYIDKHGFIINKEAREILGLADSTTKRFLKYMVEIGLLVESGERKSRKYTKR